MIFFIVVLYFCCSGAVADVPTLDERTQKGFFYCEKSTAFAIFVSLHFVFMPKTIMTNKRKIISYPVFDGFLTFIICAAAIVIWEMFKLVNCE